MVDIREDIYHRLFEDYDSPVLLINVENGNIIEANNAAVEFYGYSKEVLVSKSLKEICLFGTSLIKDRHHQSLHRLASNEIKEVEVHNLPIVLEGEVYIFSIVYDLSKHVEKEIKQRDYLTGLLNRKFFLEETETHINYCKTSEEKFGLLLMDINEFKDINDSLGHNIGDKILIEISRRLLELKTDKHLIARLGADDFAILCKLQEDEEILEYAKRAMAKMQMPFLIDNITFHLTPNMGISIYPQDGNNVEDIIRAADIALSKAKEQLGERLCFYSVEMSNELRNKILYPNLLVNAITNNEISICYQPIIDIEKDKKIVGLEALLRWKNPILGDVSPDIFIPLAEKTGQIVSIGYWVFEQVCKQINDWNKKGYTPIPISVNVSVKQLEQNGFSQSIIKLLKDYGIDSGRIELEITESVSSGDIEIIVNNLRKLKFNGFKILMDDFGTGFSSLGQLDLFELDKLKIDKIFIDDIVNVTKRQNLVRSIISMGKSLNLTVVAEGIETKEQFYYLKDLGCDLGQGYYFSKPLSTDAIESFLESQNMIEN